MPLSCICNIHLKHTLTQRTKEINEGHLLKTKMNQIQLQENPKYKDEWREEEKKKGREGEQGRKRVIKTHERQRREKYGVKETE